MLHSARFLLHNIHSFTFSSEFPQSRDESQVMSILQPQVLKSHAWMCMVKIACHCMHSNVHVGCRIIYSCISAEDSMSLSAIAGSWMSSKVLAASIWLYAKGCTVGGVCRRVIYNIYIGRKEFTIVFSHFHQLLGAFWPLVDRTQPPLCQ